MRIQFSCPLLLLGLALFPPLAKGFVTDRISAIVNKEVIAQSDVATYLELFGAERKLDAASALKELIDLKLLLAEAKKLEIPPPTDEDVKAALSRLRLSFGRPETFDLLRSRLSLTEADISLLLRHRLYAEKLIEQRILFFVFASPGEIEAYSEAHAEELKNLTPEEARKTAQGRLIAEKARSRQDAYLERLRAKADIRINRPLTEYE